nr:mechanosensitive ion channel family protein [Maliibacterium massiliense]
MPENAWTKFITWLSTDVPGAALAFGIKLAQLVLVFVLAKILIAAGKRLLKRILKRSEGKAGSRLQVDPHKADTLLTLGSSIISYTVYFFAIAAALDIFGLGITAGSLLATAGIGGIAVGLGAQSLLNDVITGFFMLFEDQIQVGDWVEIAGVSGTVESISLRCCSVRAFGGELHIIPNGKIDKVTNYCRGPMKALVDISISPEADMATVNQALGEAAEEFARAQAGQIVSPPEVMGITALEQGVLRLRVVCAMQQNTQWAGERELRRLVLKALQAHNVALAPPRAHVHLYSEAPKE